MVHSTPRHPRTENAGSPGGETMRMPQDHATTESPRQAEILDRALELVREGGLGGLTTKKIAERVGFSEPALYRHFPTKQALILGLMDRLEEMLVMPARHIAAESGLPALKRLEEIVHRHVRLVREQNSLPILLLAEASASDDPELLSRMRSIFHGYLSVLEGLFREGQSRGEVSGGVQADCMALMLLGAPAALAIRHRLLPDVRAEDRFENTLLPFLLRAFSTTDGRME